MSDPYSDLLSHLNAAQTDGCRMAWARRIVAVKEQRGDYALVIHGELTADMRELLALAIVRQVMEDKK